jgi:L-ornithine N5-oxygenase
VDKVFEARPEGRDQILREMHRTNYSGVAPDLLEDLYCEFYLDRLAGNDRKRLITMADLTAAREAADEAVIELTDRRTGAVTELHRDLVFLGTGFVREMPALVRNLGTALGLRRIAVTRQYRLLLDEPADAACYLQGVNEATHGIADSLLSVLAVRAAEIAQDILAQRLAKSNGHGSAGPGRPATPERLTSVHLSSGGGLPS